MSRILALGSAISLLASFLLSADARAQSFESLAAQAVEVEGPEALGALFWSQATSCAKLPGDLERRQCEGVRAARLERVLGQTFRIKSEGAVTASGFDAKKKSVTVAIEACVACKEPVPAVTGRRFVIGAGKHAVQGGAVRARALHESARTFADKAAADAWREAVLPRLRAEFIIKLPRRLDSWKAGSAEGFKVEILGHRVYDPCDGKIVHAAPPSKPVAADPSTCGETAKPVEVAKPAEKPVRPAEPRLPERLTTAQINEAMRPARGEAHKCFETYGVPGTANLRITISGEGKVVDLEVGGDFTDTPTGTCIDKAVRATSFPRTGKDRTSVNYPLQLR